LGSFRVVTSGCLRWAINQWHFVDVLSNSLMVGGNVGVRLPEAIELQHERKIMLDNKRKMTQRMM
jgi:hypothetical protein